MSKKDIESRVRLERQKGNETGTTTRCYRVISHDGTTLGRVRRRWAPDDGAGRYLAWFADDTTEAFGTRWQAVARLPGVVSISHRSQEDATPAPHGMYCGKCGTDAWTDREYVCPGCGCLVPAWRGE
jgi:hypothetical protein